MVANETSTSKAWVIFDRIVARAAPGGVHSNPWVKDPDGQLRYEPDYNTLVQLLGVPLYLRGVTQSGVPALALDVWMSYELRRAGFDSDQVWPRPVHPRILPASVATLLKELPKGIAAPVIDRINTEASISGVTSSSASILGKNYLKQVDVIITDWATGPELLISTKRMDSSYSNNAANRVEESYGDAKNLRLRHPLASIGFAFGLRSDILTKKPRTAEFLLDLLAKLGREDDAYHATCLVFMEYSDSAAVPDSGETAPADDLLEPGPGPIQDEAADVPPATPVSEVDRDIEQLPKVTILHEKTPAELAPSRFLATLVSRVLFTTPVHMHEEARRRRNFPEVR